jgi:hypothetical protein
MPESSTDGARRAKSVFDGSGGGDSGGTYTFDGTGDYMSWRRWAQVTALTEESTAGATKKVFKALRGMAVDVALSNQDTDNLSVFPFSTVGEILIVLDTQFSGGNLQSKQEATRLLMRLRQGNKTFEDFAQELVMLASKAKVDNTTKIAALQAGVATKLTQAAAMLEGDEEIGQAIMKLKRVDSMTPNPQRFQRGGGNDKTKGRSVTTNKPRDKSKIECYNCHKMGHFKRECRSQANKASVEKEDSDAEDIVEYSGNE